MERNGDGLGGMDVTSVRIAGVDTKVTMSDVAGLKRALLDHLQKADVAEIPDRDYLIRLTEGGPAWIDADGKVRIGAWLLQSRDRGLQLVFRMPATGGVITAYAATVVREEGVWRISDLQTERIRRRP